MASSRTSAISRALDRYAGIPLVWALGAGRAFRRRRPASERPRIGLLIPAGIGDAVVASAITQDIARQLRASITVVAGRENAGIAPLMPGVSEVATVDFARPLDVLSAVRARNFDAVIDCAPWPRITAAIAAMSSSPCTVGFRTAGQHRHYAYGFAVTHRADRHELENHRDLARALGVDPVSSPSLTVPELSPSLSVLPERYVVCHLWAGGYRAHLREWPLDRWREVIDTILSRGCPVVLTGGPGDRDASERFWRSLSREDLAIDLAGRTTVQELVAILAHSQLVLSVNTGAMHVAAAVGAPTIGLHGPTSAMRWGPVGPRTLAVSSRYDGSGFLNLGWEYDGRRTDCMEGIAPDDVLAAVRSLAPQLLGGAAISA